MPGRGLPRPPTEGWHEDGLVALAGVVWVTAWLWSRPLLALAVAVPVALGLISARRFPRLAAALVLGAGLLGAVLAVPAESPATLFPVAVVVYGLGRRCGLIEGVVGLVAFVATPTVADGLSWPTVVFAVVLYAAVWGFGRLVAAKSSRAAAAGERAARLGGRSPQQVAAAVVAEERTRLATDIVRVVGDAVRAMLADADPDLVEDPVARERIERIRQRGATAVAELRRMLGLLREVPAADSGPPIEAGPPGSQRLDRRPPTSAVVTSAVLFLVGIAELVATVPRPPTAVAVVLMALPLTLLLRRTSTVAAVLAAAGLIGLATLIQPTELGLGITVVMVLLSWSAAVDGRRATWVAWVLLAAIGCTCVAIVQPDNVAIQAVLLVLAAGAGHAWTESDRAERSARAAADVAQTAIDRAVADAVRSERLRIARDLHDVTSHALGVMVLHAGAAAAQLGRDADRARTSLTLIRQTGVHALTDLDRLVGLIDAGALGTVPNTVAEPTSLTHRLDALTRRIRQAGVEVSLELDPAVDVGDDPVGEATGDVVYRVVQESLTNALRHAPGSRVQVTVQARAGCWRVSVIDDGGPRTGPDLPGAGFGLAGVAERVRGVGGSLSAGPVQDRGWSVEVTLPDHAGRPENLPDHRTGADR